LDVLNGSLDIEEIDPEDVEFLWVVLGYPVYGNGQAPLVKTAHSQG